MLVSSLGKICSFFPKTFIFALANSIQEELLVLVDGQVESSFGGWRIWPADAMDDGRRPGFGSSSIALKCEKPNDVWMYNGCRKCNQRFAPMKLSTAR